MHLGRNVAKKILSLGGAAHSYGLDAEKKGPITACFLREKHWVFISIPTVLEQITAEWHYLTTKCFHLCEINHASKSFFYFLNRISIKNDKHITSFSKISNRELHVLFSCLYPFSAVVFSFVDICTVHVKRRNAIYSLFQLWKA